VPERHRDDREPAEPDREKQLPIDHALRIAREVADGWPYAHERGVIHRYIKPENRLLQGGHALVVDAPCPPSVVTR